MPPNDLLERPMTKRNDVSVKMDAQVVEDCRLAAAFRKMALAEYISETMRTAARKDIDEGIQRRTQPSKPKGGKGGAG
jgi:hypothetical protein